MLSGLQLPFRFDPALLRQDLATALAHHWTAHYNQQDSGGGWHGIALRSASGAPADLNAGAGLPALFADTPLLGLCPYFGSVLAVFECPLKAVRLLRLAPGAFIREHTDNALEFEEGEVRIHVPIATNPLVEFYVSGERLSLEEGAAYYLNVNLPHRVNNRGAGDRVHLVIDAAVNAWVRELFARSAEIPRCAPPPRGVDAFRSHLLAAPALTGALRAFEDPRDFTNTAVRLGTETGFDLHAGDVEAVLHGSVRPGEPGGLPYAFSVVDGQPRLDWVDAGERALTEPFFDDTVRAVLRNPYARFSRRRSPLPPAGSWCPRGFIFHMSRCGSTLAGRMLTAAGYRVLSEAAPIRDAISTNREDWLRQVIGALGAGTPAIVKLDAWHIHRLPLLRAAFPDTPWIFLYRDPSEVLVSQLRSPGRHALPGALPPEDVGMAPEDITRLPRDQWCARVLAAICSAALTHSDDPRGLFVDYRDLPRAVTDAVAAHFGIDLSGIATERMREAALYDAKNPGLAFTPDAAGKRAEAQSLAGLLAETGLGRLYEELSAATIRA